MDIRTRFNIAVAAVVASTGGAIGAAIGWHLPMQQGAAMFCGLLGAALALFAVGSMIAAANSATEAEAARRNYQRRRHLASPL